MTIDKKFTKPELAYICYNVKKTEEKQLAYELKLINYSETYDEDKIKEMFEELTEPEKETLNQYTFEYMTNYIGELNLQKSNEKEKQNKENPFIFCMGYEHHDIFYGGLLNNGETNLSWKQTCKELLVESVKIYSTPYKKQYYIKTVDYKTGEFGLKYIGEDYETYLEKLYSMTDLRIRSLIPFSSFISTIKNLRVYESLKPNRDYILFNDCLLDVNTGIILDTSEVSTDKVPYAIIDYDYKNVNHDVQKYIFELFKRIDTDNIIISLIYGMLNKRVLKKTSAIFNIQKSNTGKTLIVTPFTEMGLFRNVNHEMLKGNDKSELFKQYYTVVFEEIQEKVINGSGFNSLIDNTSMAVQRKYKEAITVPKELKPVIYINGESMPNFKGRTRGSFNRFVFVPNYKEPLTEKDYDFLTENAVTVGVELIRHLVDYMKTVSKDCIMDNIQNARKTEKEIFELKENKVKIIFEYIQAEPEITEKCYCINETIFVEMIKEMQMKGIITVDLFNSEQSIKTFIKQTIVTNMDTNISIHEEGVKNVIWNNERKTQRLKYLYQLTEKGITFVTDMGIVESSLII